MVGVAAGGGERRQQLGRVGWYGAAASRRRPQVAVEACGGRGSELLGMEPAARDTWKKKMKRRKKETGPAAVAATGIYF
jgi:hypothetical protein